MGSPRNLCTGCGQDFAGLEGFDFHRVGAHGPGEYRGPLDKWAPEQGRRCLDVEELAEKGYRQDGRGRWFNVERRERTREQFTPRKPPRDHPRNRTQELGGSPRSAFDPSPRPVGCSGSFSRERRGPRRSVRGPQ